MKTNSKVSKRIISLVLTVLLVLSMVPMSVFSAFAEEVSELTEGLADLSATIDTGAEVTLSDADGDGYYDISTADELYAFAALVNGGNTGLNAELTADIIVNEGAMSAESEDAREWTPIGNYYNSYKGTFNGNDHTVSGLYFNNSEANYVGLFGCVGTNGAVKNIGVINSYFNGDYRVGGVVGWNNYGTITNCYNEGNVSGSDCVGGVVGENYGTIEDCYNTGEVNGVYYVGGVVGENFRGTITNCYNTGAVSGSNYVGGVIGYTYYGTITNCYNTGDVNGSGRVGGVVGCNDYGTITNCYNTGTVSGSDYVGGVVGRNFSGPIINCYYLDTAYAGGIGILETTAAEDLEGSAEAKTAEQFASGEVAYLLGEAFGQKIGTDEFPTLGDDKVYKVLNCDGTDLYSNANENLDHNFVNGFCTACDAFESATLNADGVYEIGNAGQLYWFADKVNNDNANYGSANAILTADIVVNEGTMSAESTDARAWTPIGNDSNRYTGTFDGNDYTISGLYFNNSEADYVGLFGYVDTNGTVKNTGVINSYFNGHWYVGGVAGETYYGTITNCYNTGEVKGESDIGGVVGFNGNGTISNCYNTGDINGDNYAGGVVGYNRSGAIENCYNTGEVSGSSYYVGGVVGYNDRGTLTNCYNTGNVSAVGQQSGGVVGVNYEGTITNCYNTGEVSGNECVGGVVGINYGTITNCYNTGEVSGSRTYVGGVVGYNYGTITNCYNVGYISGDSRVGGVAGYNNSSNGTITNCYYLDTAYAGGINRKDIEGSAEAKTSEQFASGEVAYLLGEAFGQKIGTDEFPTLGDDKVYKVLNCDGTDLYSNANENLDHNFVNGFCSGCGNAFEPATLNADGVYEIGNAGQLYWFAEYVNAGNTSANAILTADIVVNEGETADVMAWTPIGNSDNQYTGIFDGNNMTVNFGNQTVTHNGYGLIGYMNNGTVKNVTVTGTFTVDAIVNGIGGVGGWISGTSYFEGCISYVEINLTENATTIGGELNQQTAAMKIGGIAGGAQGGAVIYMDRCANYGNINANGAYECVAGILGYGQMGKITNCHNAGNVISDTAQYVSGILGYVNYKEHKGVQNCLNTGTVSGRICAGDIVGSLRAHMANSVTNNYHIGSVGIGECTTPGNNPVTTVVTDAQLKSGEVAYLLGEAFGQKLGTDEAPTLGGDKVYYGYLVCTDATAVYTNNSNATAEKVHDFVNGFCTVCGNAFESATLNEDGVYEIANAGQLYWFADKVNNDNANFGSANAILTADIVVNEGTMSADSTDVREWTPIGNNYNIYKGTFDGNDHTVSGLYFNNSEADYVGLFGYVGPSGTVKNTGVINSYFSGYTCVGGVVGVNSGTIENCYNTGEVSGNDLYVGGVVGQNYGGTITNCYNEGEISGNYKVGGVTGENFLGIITNCYNTGTVIGSERVAGVVGENYEGKITNCYNTGEVIGSYYVGGVVGYTYNGTITNCYNTGEVSGNIIVGGVVGWNNKDAITNCYYLDTAYNGGITGEDLEGSAEAKTAEQFKSGEVAYLLGEAFGQKIGTDQLPVLGGDKVYYGYLACADDATLVYTNNAEATAEKPDHNWEDGKCTACEKDCEHDWYLGTCDICGIECSHPEHTLEMEVYPEGDDLYYVNAEAHCSTCGYYLFDYSDYAEVVSKEEAKDCLNKGSVTLSFTYYDYDNNSYTTTKTIEVESDNHVGPVENGFCSVCGGYEPAKLNDNGTPDDEWDDYYEISNAGQLYWFGEVAAANDNYSKAVLTDDIIVNEDMSAENLREWVAIGESSSMPYCGTFDGQGHFISGLYAKSELNYIGLFGAIGWGATISNLGIKDSYFEGNYYVGGIVGYCDFSYVKNCYAENVEIIAESSGGALVGYNYGEVSNSYSTSDSFVGNNYYGTITNCYYLADTDDGNGGKTAEQFASGEVAYLLQAGIEGEEIWDDELQEWVTLEPAEIWGQKIGTDTYPVLGGDKVYQVENCLGETAYSNTNEDIDHNFENGFCTVCDAFEPATLNEDGVFEIANAGQLFWFAEYVNAGNTTANAILTADIVVNEGTMTAESTDVRAWTPIGNYDNRYKGTFNGNDHTVSGLYFNNSEAEYVGLFGYVGDNGAVKSTGVINSYFMGFGYVGGVVGENDGTIENCYNTSTVSGRGAVAGVVGDNYHGTITNCYNTGGVSGSDYYVGGVVGDNYHGTITNCYNEGEVSGSSYVGGVVGANDGIIENCYNEGEVSGSYYYVGGVAGYNSSNGTITNCYYLDTAYAGGINRKDIEGSAEAKTSEQFASGEVAYLLQGQQTEDIWGQKIGTDQLPVLGGEKVYYGYITCDEADNTIGYTNLVTSEEAKPDHNFVNGFCTVCDAFEPATLNEDGVYEIGNAGQLYWFAEFVNAGNTTANAILTADIVVNEGTMSAESEGARVWTPIGNYDNRYTGTFDGNNKTVSGLYFNNSKADCVGLFGCVGTNGTVNNTGVINSYFNGSYCVGGVVGWSPFGTITNCYNTGDVNGSYHVGGVVGKSDEVIIENCYNTGEVRGHGDVGGVVGRRDEGIIENCYNEGEVSGSESVGGVVGYSCESIIENCYNTANVSGSGSYVGGVVGDSYKDTITNCYNTGEVSGSGSYVGGVVGNNIYGTITNCYNTGEVSGSGSYVGGVVGYSYEGTITNCYYLDTVYTGGIGISGTTDADDVDGSAEAKTAEQFASGEVAYLLGEAFGQKLGTDDYPVLGGDKVYTVINCQDEVTGYSNTEGETLDHNFENGFCTICGALSSSLDADGDGYYDISNADELYAFAELINSGYNDINGELLADIVVNEGVMTAESTDVREWIPIGNDSSYSGTFNGNDHYISGLYFNNSEAECAGLFGYVGVRGTVKNTGVINSYFNSYVCVGGVAGVNNGTIENCYNTGVVSGIKCVGGLVGENYGTIENCYNSGVVSGSNYVGGVVGYNEATITNCYYLDTACIGGIGKYNFADAEDIEGSAEAKTSEQFASGEVAYLLQAGVVGEDIYDDEWNYIETITPEVWGQKIGTDAYPVLGGDKVYTVINCKNENVSYNNTKSEILDHNFENGFCTVCDGYEPATLNEDGVYEISNAGQLYWFADKVNNDNANFGSANAILTADIVVNEGVITMYSTNSRFWTPIGKREYPYTGTFNGNGKTVSGLYYSSYDRGYVGLFGFVGDNGTVKNTGVVNSYFYGYDYVGGVAGYNLNGTIENCYNTGEIKCISLGGGVVGYSYGTIKNCYNTGVVSGTERWVGGVAGANDGTIENCYNTGTVNGYSYTGGVTAINVGIIKNCYNTGDVSGYGGTGGVAGDNSGTLENCYNTGVVSGTIENGGVVGTRNVGTIINCYYLDTAYDGGIGIGGTSDAEDIEGSAEAKTAEQFASGEVAYLLQGEQTEDVWGQKIGTDTYPVLGGDKVYAVKDSQGNITGYSNTNESDVTATDKLAGYTISLGDKIAVNYYMSLTEKTIADANAKMVFTVPDTGSTYTVEIPVSEAVKSGDFYVFTCEVAAKEMTSVIKAKFVTSESELQLEDYSVQKYAEYILAEAQKATAGGIAGGNAGGSIGNTSNSGTITTENQYTKAAALVKAMLNYGAEAQIYFNYNTDNLANDTEYMTEEEKITELFGFAGAPYTITGEEAGVTYYGTALSLETELMFKHYFVIDESVDVESLEITCDYPVTLQKNGSLYELKISDIPAHKMGKSSLKVSLGGITLDYTLFSYGALVQNSGNEKLWTVVSALAHFANEASYYANK